MFPMRGRCRALQGFVRFEDVIFGYNPDRPVLHDINFEAKPGQMVALVGPTGGGKSSIISLIARFYQPQNGRVLVDGQDIRARDRRFAAQTNGAGAAGELSLHRNGDGEHPLCQTRTPSERRGDRRRPRDRFLRFHHEPGQRI